MFRDAIQAAKHFAQPVLTYVQQFNGDCRAVPSTCVIINPQGWIVTAAHVVTQALEYSKEDGESRVREVTRDNIEADLTLNSKERSKKLSTLRKRPPEAIRRASTAWGHRASNLVDISILSEIDLAVGRLDPFDPSWVAQYPTFKDPNKDFMPGVTLCKLGFPLIQIRATFDDATNQFSLPPEAINLPFFPIDGIFTRNIEMARGTSAFPLKYVETSTPGLRGQSGGPTFDKDGAIWGIQSHTMHHDLGFGPEIIEYGHKHKVPQFFNTGMGVHSETVIGFLNQLAIHHTVSAH